MNRRMFRKKKIRSKVKSSEDLVYFENSLLSSKEGHDMNWSSQTTPHLLNRSLGLIPFIAGMVLLSIMLAEGCVKRPTLEPTPGVSSKALMLWES